MRAGTIFLVTTGKYSDYGIFEMLRARRDFDFDGALSEWLAQHPDQDCSYGLDQSKFMAKLIESGWVESVMLPWIHLADYSTPNRTAEADVAKQVASAETWVRACCAHGDCLEHPQMGIACYESTRRAAPTPGAGKETKPTDQRGAR